jgi:hypothetical protein
MAMQFGNLVSFQNANLSAAFLASANNTFPAACFLSAKHSPDTNDADICVQQFLQLW